MDFAASPAEVFTIDFVPDDALTGASGADNLSCSGASDSTLADYQVSPRNARHSVANGLGSNSLGSYGPNGRLSSRSSVFTNPRIGYPGGGHFVSGLDQFIGDQSNSLIHWLWQSLKEKRFDYWPLTIFGPSGVGKTKLTNRLALTALQRVSSSPAGSARVLTINAKDFFRSFRRSLEINSVAQWRERFEQVPVLLLDDLQQLLDYSDIQHELCEILDRRLANNLPTILVSNVSPLTMGLLPALCSRLSGGFCCGLSAPGPDALLTIIQRLFAIHQITISDAEARGLMDCGVSEIGLINQIIWRWKLERSNSPFQLASASQALRKLVGAANEHVVPADKVLRATAKQFECLLKDLRGSSRKSTLVRARGVAIWICRSRLKLSFKAIGKLLGNRDHTTIMNGMEKTCSLLESDPAVALATDRILQKLGLEKR